MVYTHTSFNSNKLLLIKRSHLDIDPGNFEPGNFALLPLRTRTRGPAYTLPPLPQGTSDLDVDPQSESYDALDEVLTLFRANTFFRNFEIKGPADRLLIYGILFVSECLGRIKPTMGYREAEKVGGIACLVNVVDYRELGHSIFGFLGLMEKFVCE